MAERKSPSGQIQYVGTGRRKRAIARVFLRPGEGKITINGRAAEDYFPTATQRMRITQPLQVTDATGKFDLLVLANGGGLNGQADAIRMGLARALQDFNLELRPILKKGGFLRRDPRKRERKKYGRPGARKRFQYSKR
jgi:small subunit ribosomal protein S9